MAERDILAEIQAAANKGNEALVVQLLGERYAKVNADPVLKEKYGNDAYSQMYLGEQKRAATTAPAPVAAPAPVGGYGVPTVASVAAPQPTYKPLTPLPTASATVAPVPVSPLLEAPKPADATQLTHTPTTNNAGMINAGYDSYLASQLAGIRGTTEQAVSDYQGQIDKTPETYAPQRQKVDTATARNVQNMNMAAAAKGTAFTGGVASDQSQARNVGEQQKTALTQQEINFVQSLKKAIADTQKASGYRETEATGQVDAQRNQALLGENIRVDDTNYNRNMATETFNANQRNTAFSQGMDSQNFMAGQHNTIFNQNMANQGLAQDQQNIAFNQGMANQNLNLTQQDMAFNQNRDIQNFAAGQQNTAFNQNMDTQNFNAAQQNTAFNQNMATQQFALDKTQMESQLKSASLAQAGQMITNEMNQISLDIQKDPNSPENQARAIALKQAQVELQDALTNSKYTEAEAKARVAAQLANIRQSDASAAASYASAAASKQNAQTNADQAAWDRDPANPRNIPAGAEADLSPSEVNAVVDDIRGEFTAESYTDPRTGQLVQKAINRDAIKSRLATWMNNGTYSEESIAKMATQLGIDLVYAD